MVCYRKTPEVRRKSAERSARPDYKARRNEARRVANDPTRRDKNRAELLRKNYGLTIADEQAMIEAQRNTCMICGDAPDPNGVKASSRLHVDHDHVTGKVRALICIRCNQGIGYFRDDPELLRTAALYILKHRERD
jgi:hypothetical protein